jgi:hypothetical protein
MSSAVQILKRCEGNDVSIRVEGEQLKIKAPKGFLTDDRQQALKSNKQGITTLVNTVSQFKDTELFGELLDPSEVEEYVERAWRQTKRVECQINPCGVDRHVCEWHCEEDDPRCAGCEHFGVKR